MSELPDEVRRQIQDEVAGKVAAEQWATIVERLSAVDDGPGWKGDSEVSIYQLTEGPEAGRLAWRIGNRQFLVDDDVVEETTLGDHRQPIRRRVIDATGVLVDELVVQPDLN